MATKYSDSGREYKPHNSTSVSRAVATISAIAVGIAVIISCNPDESAGSVILAVLAGGIAFLACLCLCNVYLNLSDDIKRISDIVDELDEKVLFHNNMLADLLSQEQNDRRKMYKTQIRFYNDTIRSLKGIQTEVRRLSYELDMMSFREGTPEDSMTKNNAPVIGSKDGGSNGSAGSIKHEIPDAAASEKPETGYDEADDEERDGNIGYADFHEAKGKEDANGAANDDSLYDIEYDEASSSEKKGNDA